MAIVIVTNREIVEGGTDEHAFHDRFNLNGPGELRLARADYSNGQWQVETADEAQGMTTSTVPSRLIFDEMRGSLIERGRDCVLFVHTFNQTLATSLKKCKEIQDTYGVDVVGFSWPSDPGGQHLSEYQRARAAARLSVNAFERTLHKLTTYLARHPAYDCGVSFNLLLHGTSAYMLEQLVRSPLFGPQKRLFDNVVLHQADVDHDGHAQWLDRVRLGKRIYVTINEFDQVLRWADMNGEPGRLGNSCGPHHAARASYVDFTNADLVGSAHRIYWKSRHNPHLRAFFRRALHGERAEHGEGVEFDAMHNLYHVT